MPPPGEIAQSLLSGMVKLGLLVVVAPGVVHGSRQCGGVSYEGEKQIPPLWDDN